jgi:preprotein translocase subunit SecB
MSADLPNEHTDKYPVEDVSSQGAQQFSLLAFPVQLQNLFPVDIKAERYPIQNIIDVNNVVSTAHVGLNLNNFGINVEARRAEICLEVRVNFPQEPRFFDIYFKLLGIFTYTQDCQPEIVQQFLQQGCLSVMLPSARELLLGLCTRLQIPMVVLPIIPLSPPPSSSQ